MIGSKSGWKLGLEYVGVGNGHHIEDLQLYFIGHGKWLERRPTTRYGTLSNSQSYGGKAEK